jgi:hypothetical protein
MCKNVYLILFELQVKVYKKILHNLQILTQTHPITILT